jgi:hypothetical protein
VLCGSRCRNDDQRDSALFGGNLQPYANETTYSIPDVPWNRYKRTLEPAQPRVGLERILGRWPPGRNNAQAPLRPEGGWVNLILTIKIQPQIALASGKCLYSKVVTTFSRRLHS